MTRAPGRAPRIAGRIAGRIAAALLARAALWAGGFAWFALRIPVRVDDPAAETDAIVVLTGGSKRLNEGLGLLLQGRAKKLFVSGVHRGVDVAELLRAAQRAPREAGCCIALGHEADNTAGNAAETARWMKEQNFGSLRLVTAGYHMPRALLEFRAAMPWAAILPHPVFPDSFPAEGWWRRAGAVVLAAAEYAKYLAAALRLALGIRWGIDWGGHWGIDWGAPAPGGPGRGEPA
ncbi:MAG: YdcF family protein [Rhodospirillales bacterium]